MKKRILVATVLIAVIVFLFWLINKLKKPEQPTGKVEVGDLEQFRVNDKGEIEIFVNGSWEVYQDENA